MAPRVLKLSPDGHALKISCPISIPVEAGQYVTPTGVYSARARPRYTPMPEIDLCCDGAPEYHDDPAC
jgi:hypothetical protein